MWQGGVCCGGFFNSSFILQVRALCKYSYRGTLQKIKLKIVKKKKEKKIEGERGKGRLSSQASSLQAVVSVTWCWQKKIVKGCACSVLWAPNTQSKRKGEKNYIFMPFKQVFSGCIATEPSLAHPKASYEQLALAELVHRHKPAVTKHQQILKPWTTLFYGLYQIEAGSKCSNHLIMKSLYTFFFAFIWGICWEERNQLVVKSMHFVFLFIIWLQESCRDNGVFQEKSRQKFPHKLLKAVSLSSYIRPKIFRNLLYSYIKNMISFMLQ